MTDSHIPKGLAYWTTTDTTVPSPADLHSLQREASREYIYIIALGQVYIIAQNKVSFFFRTLGVTLLLPKSSQMLIKQMFALPPSQYS